MSSSVNDTKLTTFVYWQVMSYVSYMGAFHLRSLAGNIAGKLGNAFLRYQIRQPATRFPLTPTLAMLVIPVLPVKWKAPYVLLCLDFWLCPYVWRCFYVGLCLYLLLCSFCLAMPLYLIILFCLAVLMSLRLDVFMSGYIIMTEYVFLSDYIIMFGYVLKVWLCLYT